MKLPYSCSAGEDGGYSGGGNGGSGNNGSGGGSSGGMFRIYA